tara:strand:- start:75 stop:281 length:207 start_codon:yes stop_codon:yes gene_type:complete
MSYSSNKKLNVDSVVVLSLEQYKNIVDEDSSDEKGYSKVGHLYKEKNTPQYRWFKGSRYRGVGGDIAA